MMNSNDALELCAAVEALLSAHAGDDGITGRAREDARREFARHTRPMLVLAVEKIQDLVGEVAFLRTGVNESEDALLRMFSETQAEVERLCEKMVCGHPKVCEATMEDGHGTAVTYCAWCEDVECISLALKNAARNVDYLRELLAENVQSHEIMTCGHPRACLVSSDAEHDSTVNCAWCANKAQWEALLDMTADNAEGFRELLVESERKVMELEAEAQLNAIMLARQCDLAREAETALARERMRATSRAGSVPR